MSKGIVRMQRYEYFWSDEVNIIVKQLHILTVSSEIKCSIFDVMYVVTLNYHERWQPVWIRHNLHHADLSPSPSLYVHCAHTSVVGEIRIGSIFGHRSLRDGMQGVTVFTSLCFVFGQPRYVNVVADGLGKATGGTFLFVQCRFGNTKSLISGSMPALSKTVQIAITNKQHALRWKRLRRSPF